MRVLIWQERNPDIQGGAESWVSDTARGLKARGHEAAWLHSPFIGSAVDTFKPDAVIIGTIQNFIGVRHAEVLAHKHPDIPAVWFLHDYWPFCEPRMLMRERNRSDVACEAVRGLCDNCCGGRHAVPEVLQRFALATGCEGAAAIMRRHGLNIAHVIEEGIDTEQFRPNPGERDWSCVYASAAWDAPWKGMHLLAEACKQAGVPLRLLTGLTREEVARNLGSAGLFVMPSLYEEIWGLACTEAMSSGCAVVTTDVAGLSAQTHPGLGVLVSPHDLTSLRDAIADCLAHPDSAEEMGQRARGHVCEDHSLEAVGRRWEAVLCAS